MEQHFRRETFSWKATTSKGQGRDAGWTAAQVIGEALRQGDRFPHVERPLPPTPMRLPHRDDVADEDDRPLPTIASLMIEVDRVAEAARIVDVLGRERRLPPNTSVLCSDVVSTPWKSANIQTDPDLRERTDAFFRDALAWAAEDIEQRGGRVIAAVVHYDENQAHLHILSVAEHGLARDLHPGYVAKAKVLDRARGAEGKGDVPADAYHEANEAYTAAMSELLDSFHRDVAVHHGLDRRSATPVRRREWSEVRLERLRADTAYLETTHDGLVRAVEDREATAAMLDARIVGLERDVNEAQDRARRAEAAAYESERKLNEVQQRCTNGEAALTTLIGRWRNGRQAIGGLLTQHAELTGQVEDVRMELTEATENRDAALEAACFAKAAEETALSTITEREREMGLRLQALEERERALDEREAMLQRQENRVAKRTSKALELLVSLRNAHVQVKDEQRWLNRTAHDLDTTIARMGHELTASLSLLLERTDDKDARNLIEDPVELGTSFADVSRSIRDRAPKPVEGMQCRMGLMQDARDALIAADIVPEHVAMAGPEV